MSQQLIVVSLDSYSVLLFLLGLSLAGNLALTLLSIHFWNKINGAPLLLTTRRDLQPPASTLSSRQSTSQQPSNESRPA